MSAPTITRDLLVAHTRALKLPGVARHFEALARQAQEAHSTYEDYLHEVLSAEQVSRHESVIRQRLREARFPEVKTLDTFDSAGGGRQPGAGPVAGAASGGRVPRTCSSPARSARARRIVRLDLAG